MKSPISIIGGTLCCVVLACSPSVPDQADGSGTEGTQVDGTSTTSMPSPGTTTSTTETPPPPATGDTTAGSSDTSVGDTEPMRPDLPQDCSLTAQDCPPGSKCAPFDSDGDGAWDDTQCIPVARDPSPPGEPCTVEGLPASGVDDCDGTSMCWDVNPKTGEGTCVAHCIGEEPRLGCVDPCQRCVTAADSILALCLPTCDPLLLDCPRGEACYPVSEFFACVPDASPPNAGIGTPCQSLNGCPPAMQCVGTMSLPACDDDIGCCTPVCEVGGVDPCPGLVPGTECVPWYPGRSPVPPRCTSGDPGVCLSPPP